MIRVSRPRTRTERGRMLSCGLFLAMLLWRPCAGQTPPAGTRPRELTFSVQSQLVQIFFTVTEGKRRVTDVTLPAVTLTEDGREQRIERLDTGTVPLQIALLLDNSESMRDSLPAVQKAAAYFLESLQPPDRVTLVTFNSDISSLTQTTEDRAPLLAAIKNLRASGNTRLFDALLFAMKQLSGKQGRKAIVSFSDGEDTARSSSLNAVLNASALYGFPIYTVGAGSGLERDNLKHLLKQLADTNGAASYFLEDPTRLRGTFAEISDELRSAYVLSYYTTVPLDGRWHETRIKLANPRYQVSARRGFFARPEMSSGLLTDERHPQQLARADFDRPAPPVTEAHAMVAFRELQSAPLPPARDIDRTLLRPPDAVPVPDQQAKRPVFKVESRFVEVPVLVESLPGDTLPELSQRDFQIYEDSALQEIAFFRKAARQEDLPGLREAALSGTSASRPSPVLADPRELILGRIYLLIDNTSSEAGAFLRAKDAASKLIAEHYNPVRPVSAHLTSESSSEIAASESVDQMLAKLKKAGLQSDRELSSNDGIMTIYEAYLIENGDRDARQMAELRYAAAIRVSYRNDLGEVQGSVPGEASMIQSSVTNTAVQLLARNFAQTNRTLDGLKAVVSAAATDPGEYPKTVVLLSSGFSMGRASSRSNVASALDAISKNAKAHGIRVISVNAAGLETEELIGIGANGDFLVNNPSLTPLLTEHETAWRHDREAPLAQLALETGGRFVNSTNDLVSGAGLALGGTAQIYYLGFLSSQPMDGRFHRIRVLSAKGRVHARGGFYARPYVDPGGSEADTEPLDVLMSSAGRAQKSGDVRGVAEALDKVARKVPDNPDVLYNLAAARMALNEPEPAIAALQKALVLAPRDKLIGSALARALVSAGYRQAAAETLQELVRKHPRDISLLVDLGRVYEADSRLTDAYQAYRSVLDITLAPPLDLYLLLTRTSVQLGRRMEANLFIRDFLSRGGPESSIREWLQALAKP